MKTSLPRHVIDYAASFGVMVALLVGALSLCATPEVIRIVLSR